MVRYYKTTGLYANIDLLKFELVYEKGKGYSAWLSPCNIDKYGNEGRFYCAEYYKYFGMQSVDLVPSSRRNAKKEAEAIKMIEEKGIIDMLIDHYTAYAEDHGRNFEVICELEELRK